MFLNENNEYVLNFDTTKDLFTNSKIIHDFKWVLQGQFLVTEMKKWGLLFIFSAL